MAIRGTVTNIGGDRWKACYIDGEFAGIFGSQREAQVPIEQSANARLKWVLDEGLNATGIESYNGEDV